MKTIKATNVSFIGEVTKDGQTRVYNIFVIQVPNKPNLIRSAKEFMTDLRESSHIGSNVTNPNDARVLRTLRYLKQAPFTVSGDIIDVKKGDKWTVTENSRAITDKNHPLYGEVSVGDKVPSEKDATLVGEGFLKINYHPAIVQQMMIAEQIAEAQQSMLNTYDDVMTSGDDYGSSSNGSTNLGADDIPADVLEGAFDDVKS